MRQSRLSSYPVTRDYCGDCYQQQKLTWRMLAEQVAEVSTVQYCTKCGPETGMRCILKSHGRSPKAKVISRRNMLKQTMRHGA